ncbi:MAG: hypothetical protein GKR89_35350 [Candidatus Latescibacteria bacterium]|nr:hypothetical protein [Candidatus Latescibacterota bacterium]
MNKSKIVIVDGFMGAGKSTTAELISRVYLENQIASRSVRENERPHPTKVEKVRSVAEYINRSCEKWSALVAAVLEQDEVVVLDGQLFHFNIDEMLFLDAGRDEIVNHVEQIVDITKPANPALVYCHTQDLCQEFASVFSARGKRWGDQQVRRKTKSQYCLKRGLSGVDGVQRLYTDYRRIVDDIFPGLNLRKIAVNKSTEPWEKATHRILQFLFRGAYKPSHNYDGGAHQGAFQGDIQIFWRNSLRDLSWLGLLTQVNGDLRIRHNPHLADLKGLEGLKEVVGRLDFCGNPSLATLRGLENLQRVGVFHIRNTALHQLSGLAGLTAVNTSLRIQSNPNLTDLNGLNNLVEIKNLTIQVNPILQSLSGLEGIDRIEGGLDLNELSSLVDFRGLGNLREIRGDLEIAYNDQLTSLKGLESLEAIGGELRIYNNPKLSSLQAITGLKKVGSLAIQNNPCLSNCGVDDLKKRFENKR